MKDLLGVTSDRRKMLITPRYHRPQLLTAAMPAQSGAAVDYRGILSQDNLHFGELSVSNFTFEEWTSSSCNSIGCVEEGYEGVLGLAPPWSDGSRLDIRNILSTMLAQNLLG